MGENERTISLCGVTAVVPDDERFEYFESSGTVRFNNKPLYLNEPQTESACEAAIVHFERRVRKVAETSAVLNANDWWQILEKVRVGR
jgi:hypothetical protein